MSITGINMTDDKLPESTQYVSTTYYAYCPDEDCLEMNIFAHGSLGKEIKCGKCGNAFLVTG